MQNPTFFPEGCRISIMMCISFNCYSYYYYYYVYRHDQSLLLVVIIITVPRGMLGACLQTPSKKTPARTRAKAVGVRV